MASLGIYLAYENAKEAMEYYVDVFDAEVVHRLAITKEMNEVFMLDEDALANSTYSGRFIIDGVTIACSDRVDNNGDFNDSFNVMIEYNQDDEVGFQRMRSLLLSVDRGVVVYDSQAEEYSDHLMFRFKDVYGVIWSFIVV
jgi:PhnB protein